MKLDDSDINLLYFGGSGGFFLLHLLLLEGTYFCELPSTLQDRQDFFEIHPELKSKIRINKQVYDAIKGTSWPEYEVYYNNFEDIALEIQNELDEFTISAQNNLHSIDQWVDFLLRKIINKQWDIQTSNEWKQNESWPNNDFTFTTRTNAKQHKIYFHCGDVNNWIKFPGKKLLLYTDIETQYKLAEAKSAWIFNPDEPFKIGENVLGSAFTDTLNNHTVSSEVKRSAEFADEIIYLQDILRDAKYYLGISENPEQQEFITNWINLHKKFNIHETII